MKSSYQITGNYERTPITDGLCPTRYAHSSSEFSIVKLSKRRQQVHLLCYQVGLVIIPTPPSSQFSCSLTLLSLLTIIFDAY